MSTLSLWEVAVIIAEILAVWFVFLGWKQLTLSRARFGRRRSQ